MVKHQKEKLYQSAREHRATQQQHRTSSSSSGSVRQLPFNCCALTLSPYQHPVCTKAGIIFETSAIMPYLLKHGVDPVSGEPMTSRDLITLQMSRQGEDDDNTTLAESQGAWQCPVMHKPLSNHTKIVAILQHPPGNQANVYSYQAVEELNLKSKHYEDLLSGNKFHPKKDIIVLNDPKDEALNRMRDIDNFVHVKTLRKANTANQQQQQRQAGALASSSKGSGNVRMSVTAQRIMDQLHDQKKKKQQAEAEAKKKKEQQQKEQEHEQEEKDGKPKLSKEELEQRWEAMREHKQKAYAKLHTNLGVLNVELHCDIVPQTCDNFIGLALQKNYDGSVFHRSIKNFMIQGGKPASKSSKKKNKKKRKKRKREGLSEDGGLVDDDDDDDAGDSLWGGPFKDEFDNRLSHDTRGIMSMANAGPDTNRCQFFITYKACTYLDRKHTVFGRVISGLDTTLTQMEKVPTLGQDVPETDIVLNQVEIVSNPIEEAVRLLQERLKNKVEKEARAKEARIASAFGGPRLSSKGAEKSKAMDKKSDSAPGKKKSESESDNGNGKKKEDANEGGDIGKYLPKQAMTSIFDDPNPVTTEAAPASDEKKKKKKKKRKRKEDDPGGVPSRLPKPPKRTVFQDFSSW